MPNFVTHYTSKPVENINKAIGVPITYLCLGPAIGLVRGVQGHNTPLDYKQLYESNEGKGSMEWVGHIKDDDVADIGCWYTMFFGSATAAVPWAVARGGRALVYDLPKKIFK